MKRDKRYRLEQVSIERAWNSSTYIKLKFEVIEGRDDRKFLARPRTFATTDILYSSALPLTIFEDAWEGSKQALSADQVS